MKFKEFLKNEDLKGLFGDPVKVNTVNPVRDNQDFFRSPTSTKKGGSTVKRMLGSGNITSSPRPTALLPKQKTLPSNLKKKPEYFKSPKTTQVKPLGLL